MEQRELHALLEAVAAGELSTAAAERRLAAAPFEDLGYAKNYSDNGHNDDYHIYDNHIGCTDIGHYSNDFDSSYYIHNSMDDNNCSQDIYTIHKRGMRYTVVTSNYSTGNSNKFLCYFLLLFHSEFYPGDIFLDYVTELFYSEQVGRRQHLFRRLLWFP